MPSMPGCQAPSSKKALVGSYFSASPAHAEKSSRLDRVEPKRELGSETAAAATEREAGAGAAAAVAVAAAAAAEAEAEVAEEAAAKSAETLREDAEVLESIAAFW